jgi:hypothetical protein
MGAAVGLCGAVLRQFGGLGQLEGLSLGQSGLEGY